ncbi:hypothetical protein ACS0TY_025672 [Phlomoides rotata]
MAQRLVSSHNPTSRRHGRALKPQIGLEILGNLTNQPLERKLLDQKLSRFLVLSDLTESNGTGAESVGLLHSASGRGRFPGGFGSQLLP